MIPTITETQKQQFKEDGFFILENVFTQAEMDHIAAHIEVMQKRHEERLRAGSVKHDISRADEITFTDHLAEQNEALEEFCTRPEFVTIATTLLGPDVDLYWNQAVFKAPEGHKEFPWHQDDGYTPVTPSPYLTLWLALNDATVENGCVSVMPASHKKGLVPHRHSDIGLVCHDSDDPNQGVPVPVKAGCIAVFHSLTFHKSGVNTSQGIRKAYIVQYAHAGLRSLATGELIDNKIALARNGQPAALAAV